MPINYTEALEAAARIVKAAMEHGPMASQRTRVGRAAFDAGKALAGGEVDAARSLARRVLSGNVHEAYAVGDKVFPGKNLMEAAQLIAKEYGGIEKVPPEAEFGRLYHADNETMDFISNKVNAEIAQGIPESVLYRRRPKDKGRLMDDLLEQYLADKYRKMGLGE